MLKTITETEHQLIRHYRSRYALANDSNTPFVPNELLLRFWEDEKSKYLWELFKHQLILSKPVKVKMEEKAMFYPIDHLVNEHPFVRLFNRTIDRERMSPNYDHSWLFDTNALITNLTKASGRIVKGDKEVCWAEGQKTMRVIAKIVKEFDIDEPYANHITAFEDFRRKHSQILNTKTLTGELCLSIHPLDYITMSMNDSNWHSCMDWDDGDYRQGTVEMMNSPTVVVAYLKSSKGMKVVDDLVWNNKKWRELFIVTPDMVAGVKGYPYQSHELENVIFEWIDELMCKLNPKTSMTKIVNVDSRIAHLPGNKTIHIECEIGAMYPDFDSNTIRARFSLDEQRDYVWVKYSGESQCMWCGQADDFIEGEYEHSLLCSSCRNEPDSTCQWCGDSYWEHELTYVDGSYLCPYCLEHDTVDDLFTGEHILKRDDYEITLYSKKMGKVLNPMMTEGKMKPRYARKDDRSQYLPIVKRVSTKEYWWVSRYYHAINVDKASEESLIKYFNLTKEQIYNLMYKFGIDEYKEK